MTLDEIIRINKWINFLIAGFVFVLVQFYFNTDCTLPFVRYIQE